MQIKVKLVYQIFVTKPRRIQWRTEEAYLKSEAVAALPKLRRGLGGADFEDCFLKDAGHDRVYCFRLAPKVSLPSGSENDRDGLIPTPKTITFVVLLLYCVECAIPVVSSNSLSFHQ